MSIELTSDRKNYLNTVLYKVQFQQKLGLKYKLLSGETLLLALCIFFLDFLPPIWKVWIFLFSFFVYSKWFFNVTRNKGYFEPFLIRIYADLKRRVLLNIREKYQANKK